MNLTTIRRQKIAGVTVEIRRAYTSPMSTSHPLQVANTGPIRARSRISTTGSSSSPFTFLRRFFRG